MQFSKKERFLIIVLLAAVFLLGGYQLLINPAIAELTQTAEELAEAQLKLNETEMNLARADSVKQENVDLVSRAEEQAAVFFPNLESDRLQIYFNEIMTQAGVTAQSFSFSQKEYAELPTFISGYIPGDYTAKDYANRIRQFNELEPVDAYENPDDSTASTGAAAGTKNNKLFEKMEVSLQFACTYQQALNFVNFLDQSGRFAYLSSFVITGATGGEVSVTAVVTCYGTVKVSDLDALITDSLTGRVGKNNPFAQ